MKIEGAKTCKLLLNTDWERFGGRTNEEADSVTINQELLNVMLQPFSGILISIL